MHARIGAGVWPQGRFLATTSVAARAAETAEVIFIFVTPALCRAKTPILSMRYSQPADRPLIGGKRDAQHHGVPTESEAPVRLVPIPDAKELEDAVLVSSLLHANELPVLPPTVNQG